MGENNVYSNLILALMLNMTLAQISILTNANAYVHRDIIVLSCTNHVTLERSLKETNGAV